MNINSTKSHEPQRAHSQTINSKALLKRLLFACLLVCGHITLTAATITVTNGNDAGAGSLRQAIADAVAGDVIDFSGVTTVTLTSDQLFIDKNLTINGGTTGVTITRDAGATAFRIFNISGATTTVVFSKLTITNGKNASQSGGVENNGILTLNDCIIANNESPQGGGIQNNLTLTMNRCFVYNNSALSQGSGLMIYGSMTTLNNCVFTNNQGAYAIDMSTAGTLTITNCTIAKNTGGGIKVSNSNATVTLKNTIVAENTGASSANIRNNVSASSAYNLIGTEGGNGGLTNGTNNNFVGSSPLFANSSDPDGADEIFGTADDGLRLLTCSPALNAGNTANAPVGSDIVGNSRTFGANVDMGAYEAQAASTPVPTITLGTIPNTILAGATTFNIPYTATGLPTTYSISGTGFTTLTDAALPSSPITVNLSPAASINIDFTLTVKSASGCTSSAKTGSIAVLTPLTDACATANFNGTAPIAPTATTAGVGGKGGIYTYTVPAGVTAIRLDARGAKGGSSPNHFNNTFVGGQGGRMQATYAVTPGDVLYILVGGKGGNGSIDNGVQVRTASGGGGATVVSKGPIGTGTLLLVAGGGGGAGHSGGGGNSNNAPNTGAGAIGAGGASFSANGGNSTVGDIGERDCGQGGQALNAGGNGGANACFRPETNGGGYGGGGAGNYSTPNGNAGGGGGGGYVGGNGGGTAGGNGGSSYTDPSATNRVPDLGKNETHTDDNGSVVISVAATISYTGSPFCKSLTATAAPTTTGYTGGTFSSTAGLTIDATTGVINPSTSTAGTYTVSYNTLVGCPAATTTVKIQAITTPSVSINPTPICVGTSPTLTAIAMNGGSSPQFTWTKNNINIPAFSNKTTANSGLGNNGVNDVYVANNGTIYAATFGGLSISSNGGTSFSNKTTADGLGNNNVLGVYVDNAGKIYAATSGGGLSISNNGGTSFMNKTTADGLGSNIVRAVYVDNVGKIYAATSGGLSISNNGGTSFMNKTTTDGLGSNNVRAVYVDNAGTLYLATYGGLSISSNGGTSFTNKTTANGLGHNDVVDVYVDNTGKIYAATYYKGLSISTDGGGSFINKTTADGLGSDLVYGIYVDNAGTLYLATYGGLSISSNGGTSFINKTTADGLGSNVLYDVHVGNNGKIYVGTDSGLSITIDKTLPVSNAVAGDVYRVTLVSSADACSSVATATASVTVSDCFVPSISCPPTIRIEFNQLTANGSALPDVTGFLKTFIQVDNVSFTDQKYDVNCGTITGGNLDFNPTLLADAIQALRRTFIAKNTGSIISYSCSQQIYVGAPKLADVVFPTDKILPCADSRIEPTDTSINHYTILGTGFPTVFNQVVGEGLVKNLTQTYTDQRITNPNGFTIKRTWVVKNVCTGETRTFVQNLTYRSDTGTCPTALSTISGRIRREDLMDIPAKISVFNAANEVLNSLTNPTYSFNNLLVNKGYRVTAERPNTDWTNGVTTFDVALISRHVLGITPLATPYQLIAADANRNGEVDAADLLHFQRLILRLDNQLPNNNSWRFVPKNYQFSDPTNPFASDFPEVLNVSNLTSAVTNGDFVAIKVGDVNNSLGATSIRGGAKPFLLNAEDKVLEKGKTYQIPIQLTPSVSSLQFTLNVDKNAAKIENIENGNLPNFTENNRGLFQKQGFITAVWYQQSGQLLSETDNFTMMTVTLIPTKNTRLSEIMSINSAVIARDEATEGVAYDAKGIGLPVQLTFGNKTVNSEKAVLLPNRPNPFSHETTLSFILPEAGKAKLTVCDLLGKVVMVSEKQFAKGLNEVVFDTQNTPSVASGVFVVRLQTVTGVAEQKIVLQR